MATAAFETKHTAGPWSNPLRYGEWDLEITGAERSVAIVRAGFAAAAMLFSGHRPEYEIARDEYLKRKGWRP
jgi:hypothetical protein